MLLIANPVQSHHLRRTVVRKEGALGVAMLRTPPPPPALPLTVTFFFCSYHRNVLLDLSDLTEGFKEGFRLPRLAGLKTRLDSGARDRLPASGGGGGGGDDAFDSQSGSISPPAPPPYCGERKEGDLGVAMLRTPPPPALPLMYTASSEGCCENGENAARSWFACCASRRLCNSRFAAARSACIWVMIASVCFVMAWICRVSGSVSMNCLQRCSALRTAFSASSRTSWRSAL